MGKINMKGGSAGLMVGVLIFLIIGVSIYFMATKLLFSNTLSTYSITHVYTSLRYCIGT